MIYVRRDVCCSLGPRSGCDEPCHSPTWPLNPFPYLYRVVARCETDDLGDWEKYHPAGCPIVLGPDATDPDYVDVYTSSATRYGGINWFSPSL